MAVENRCLSSPYPLLSRSKILFFKFCIKLDIFVDELNKKTGISNLY